jgi:DNA replicative helicase MCM subunit Mcm2 (Cdc46/Mcm family)
MLKKILIFLLAALIIIQFFHPKRNKATGEQPNYIGKVYLVPEDVKSILGKACNDCHSNNTRYPWYCNFQPFDWWTAGHINQGKRGLNFDAFTSRPLRWQYHRLQDIEDQVKKGDMPLNSYTWIHKDAILTDKEKNQLLAWVAVVRDSMKAKYPIDSLVRKK